MNKEKEELNRWCHTVLLGKQTFIDHQWRIPEGETVFRCLHCKKHRGLEGRYCKEVIPNYADSLDLASIVEAKAIEVAGWDLYLGMLEVELYAQWRRAGRPKPKQIKDSQQLITADAPTRCKAARAMGIRESDYGKQNDQISGLGFD